MLNIGGFYKYKNDNTSAVGVLLEEEETTSTTHCNCKLMFNLESARKGCYMWAFSYELEEATMQERLDYLERIKGKNYDII